MTSSPNPKGRRELDSLLSAYCDGQLGHSGEKRLAEILEGDREARRYYLHYLDLHLDMARRVDRSNVVPLPVQKSHRAWQAVAAVAVMLVLGMGALLLKNNFSKPSGTDLVEQQVGEPAVAFVSRAEGVEWDYANKATLGLELEAEDVIDLSAGKLRLDFFDGSSATLVAPAKFVLFSARELALDSGQVAVPSDGPTSGFTVRTPGAAFVDVGTEFAISVVDSVGTKLRVIEGEVVAMLLSGDGVALEERSALAGDYLTVDPFDGIAVADLEPSDFPEMLAPAAQPLKLRPGYASKIVKSKPVGYWRFEALADGGVQSELGSGHKALPLGETRLEGKRSDKNQSAVLEGEEFERGFFVSEPLPQFSSGEYSVELWFNPQSQRHSGLVSLVEIDADSLQEARMKPPEHRMMSIECTGGELSRFSQAPQGRVCFAHRRSREVDTKNGWSRDKHWGWDKSKRSHGEKDRSGGKGKGEGEAGKKSNKPPEGEKKKDYDWKKHQHQVQQQRHRGEKHGANRYPAHNLGRFAAGSRDFESRVYSESRYTPGKWHHVVAVREKEQILLYLNGELEATTDSEPGSDLFELQVIIGRYSLAGSWLGKPFDGRIDELAIYDRALSADEVYRHSQLGK